MSDKANNQDDLDLRVAYELAGPKMREAVGSFDHALQNEPVNKCLQIIARERQKRRADHGGDH